MTEYNDLCLESEYGKINMRVGAIIMQNGKVLMVSNENEDYYYSVGGRIKFGETTEEAILREVQEETGYALQIDHLGFVQENIFHDAHSKKLVHEFCYFFYMTLPEHFEVFRKMDSQGERLVWVDPTTIEKPLYPKFFKTSLRDPKPYIQFIRDDDR